MLSMTFKRYVTKRKLSLGFKYVRFKSYFYVRPPSAYSTLEFRVNRLSDILKCNIPTAEKIISQNRTIVKIDSKDFELNAKFCSEFLTYMDVVECPGLMSIKSSLLQHQYFSLKELGIINPTASSILRFQELINMTPKALATTGIQINPDCSINDFVDFLSASKDINEPHIRSQLKKKYEDGTNLRKIKEIMSTEFLGCKLKFTSSKAQKMLKKYPPLTVQSYFKTSQLLDLLLQKLNVPTNKLFYHPHLLSLHNEAVETFLENLPDILGVSTALIVQNNPLILKKSEESVRHVESILKSFNISDEQLLSCPKIPYIGPRTLRHRLQHLCNSEDFVSLKPCKEFLWFVYHYKKVNSRLNAFKKNAIPLNSDIFMLQKKNLKRYIEYSACQSHISDICHYLGDAFNWKHREVISKLGEFPTLHNPTLANCKQVVEFLRSAGVNKIQIFNGLGIVFYDFEVVKEYFNIMKNHPMYQPFSDWTNHYNLVQLLIYTLEKKNLFLADVSCSGSEKCTQMEESYVLTGCAA